MWLCAHECSCIRRPEASNSLERELQAVVTCLMWVLGTELQSSGTAASVPSAASPYCNEIHSLQNTSCEVLWTCKDALYSNRWALFSLAGGDVLISCFCLGYVLSFSCFRSHVKLIPILIGEVIIGSFRTDHSTVFCN